MLNLRKAVLQAMESGPFHFGSMIYPLKLVRCETTGGYIAISTWHSFGHGPFSAMM
jgi:hypothetical protein